MLEVKQISFRYQKHPWLFRNLSLSIKRGEIVGIFGKSGSGKTTLAKIIAGYMKPTEGSILINGNQVQTKNIYPIQLIWQHAEQTIHPNWRMKQVLQETPFLTNNIIDQIGIESSLLERYPHELSGGELQRFSIARALGTKAPFLIADEITSMFDAITQAQIWGYLTIFSKQAKIGMIVISHNKDLLRTICDRIIHFSQLTNDRTT